MVILDYLFSNINSDAYNDMIMFDLPLILESSKIEINEFFSRSSSDQNKYSLISDLCNMETIFQDAELPVFSDEPTEYIELSYFKNPHNIQNELKDMISDRDRAKSEGVTKNFEVEHFYINFTILIMGEKIRAELENQRRDTNEQFALDNVQLASYLARDDDNMEFYQ